MSVKHTKAEWFAKVHLASSAWGTWGRILWRWPQPQWHQPTENITSKYHIPYTMPKLLLPLKGLLKEPLKCSSSPLLSKVSFHSWKVHKMLLSDEEKAPCRGFGLLHSTPHSYTILKCFLMLECPVVLTNRIYFQISKAFRKVFPDSPQSCPLCTKCLGCSEFSMCFLRLVLKSSRHRGKSHQGLSLPLLSPHA